ncbi:GNAT family N-acetyltransferase [Streptomyces platensis]|uniref:GNAT family N-acetyltransferase n=1 Tax=Streptomyces platensis TaxID=58346 RepID=UPI002E8078C4|nr:GNAT family N-acetyltransferase [Streptomyces platensis]WTI51537.1 GNAT family N-acetyltransferase [Streptomyces platensis]WUB82915.1 GNAT family N-acetyltransferase [Streptomyces platensis]
MRPAPDAAALQVRAVTAADLPAIAALHTGARAAYHRARFPDAPFDVVAERARRHDAWLRDLARGDTPALCAARHGTVVGAASYRHRADHHRPAVTLHQLHVDPGHWGTGVGRALHGACLRAWRTAGFSRAVLDVLWHNHRARAFYTRLGWRPDPDRRPAPDATHLTLTLDLATPAAPAPGAPAPAAPDPAGR